MRVGSTLLIFCCLLSMAGAQWREGALPAQAAPTPARLALEQMSPAERQNSRISVEFESSDGEEVALGHEVERLWNDGQHDSALAQLGDLETRIGRVAVGNSWRTPIPTYETNLWGTDVRIGKRDSLSDMALVLDTTTGNLFAVLRHSGDAPHWSICMSFDHGASWQETFAWVGSSPPSIDAAVLGSHVYVVYNSPAENVRQVRARRFLCLDCSVDTFPSGAKWNIACLLDSEDTMKEVSLVSGRIDNRLCLYTLTSGGSVWSCGTYDDWYTWNQSRMVSANALSGLDVTENKGPSSTYNFLSYYDASDTLRVYRCLLVGGHQLCFSRLAGNGSPTSISAYNDTVICAYEDEVFSSHQVRYALRYGDGDTWTVGTLSSADTAADFPAVAACGGGAFGAVFRHCAPAGLLRFRQRTDSGPWSEPISLADNEPYSSRPAMVWLGAGVYGMAYLSDTSPVVRGAFFDRSDWPYGLAEQQRSRTPVRTPLATIVSGVLYVPGRASASSGASLLDISGKEVLGLKTGANDVRALAPGVYFVREAEVHAEEQAVWRIIITG